MKDILKSIPAFSDNAENLNWSEWHLSFQQTMEDNSIEMPHWGTILVQRLDGKAKREQSAMTKETHCVYDLVVNKFNRVFNSSVDRRVAQRELKDCKQLPSEIVREFADFLQALARRAYPDKPEMQEERLKEQFSEGLADYNMYSRATDFIDAHPRYLF